MKAIYSFLVGISGSALKLIALFNPKIKLFVQGRKNVIDNLGQKIKKGDRIIWFHAASLGEYEQGFPLLEALRNSYASHKILLTFFSPSGYEVKKDSAVADIITYLPLDTARNARKFTDTVQPELAIFIKYEVWPNFLRELENRKIPTLLIAANFNKNQIYFKPFGRFLRNSLKRFSKIFVQNDKSKSLLTKIGYNRVEISGDTRFDRVAEILERDNHLELIEQFKGGYKCLVAGSTWVEDENILLKFINTSKEIKIIIAPHNIKREHISRLVSTINKKTAIYSNCGMVDLIDFEVLIVDSIGLLTKIYSYADIAYVGGGFKTGLHNTLEPAVFGVPVIIGPKYHGFAEAEKLVEKGGLCPIRNEEEFNELMNDFLHNKKLLREKGEINSKFVQNNLGATKTILKHIKDIL